MRSWGRERATAVAGTLVLGFALLAVPASAAAAAAHHGFERFRVSTHNVGARKDRVRAIGALDAVGYAVPSAIASGRGTVRLQLPRGSIVLQLRVVTSSVTVPNPATCDFTEANSGTFRISKGSGRYRRAAGSGKFHTRIRGRLAKSDGVCTGNLATYSKYQVAWGPLSW